METFENTGLPKEVIELLSKPQDNNDLKLVLKNLGEGFTAIRDDELPLARDVASMVAAFFGSALGAWAPSAIAALIFFLIDIRKKGFPLTTAQGLVLKELKSNHGLLKRQLAEGLSMEEANVDEILESLGKVTNLKNRQISLVELRDGNKWYAVDV